MGGPKVERHDGFSIPGGVPNSLLLFRAILNAELISMSSSLWAENENGKWSLYEYYKRIM
jgi:hypothetical protein